MVQSAVKHIYCILNVNYCIFNSIISFSLLFINSNYMVRSSILTILLHILLSIFSIWKATNYESPLDMLLLSPYSLSFCLLILSPGMSNKLDLMKNYRGNLMLYLILSSSRQNIFRFLWGILCMGQISQSGNLLVQDWASCFLCVDLMPIRYVPRM